MKKNLKKLVIFLFLSMSIFSTYFISARAQSGLDLTISPVILDITASPGERLQERIRLRNNRSEDQILNVSIYKMDAKGEDGSITPIEPTEDDEHIQWIKFDTPEFVAKSREWVDLNLTIEIPETAGFGYYYAIGLSEQSDLTESNNAARFQAEALVPVLLNVQKEGAIAEGKVVEFKTKSYINEYLPVEFTAKVANSGNIHIKPKGNIFIKGLNNNEVASLEINNSSGNILPGTNRIFESSWNDGFLVREKVNENNQVKLDSKGNPVTRLKVNWNKLIDFRLGKYTAYMIMVYDNGERDIPIEATTTFWIIPYKLLSAILLFIIILILLIRYLLRIYVKKQIQKYESKSRKS